MHLRHCSVQLEHLLRHRPRTLMSMKDWHDSVDTFVPNRTCSNADEIQRVSRAVDYHAKRTLRALDNIVSRHQGAVHEICI